MSQSIYKRLYDYSNRLQKLSYYSIDRTTKSHKALETAYEMLACLYNATIISIKVIEINYVLVSPNDIRKVHKYAEYNEEYNAIDLYLDVSLEEGKDMTYRKIWIRVLSLKPSKKGNHSTLFPILLVDTYWDVK